MLRYLFLLHIDVGMAYLQLQESEKALQAHQTAQTVLEQSLAQHSSLMPHLQPALAQTYGSIGKVYQSQQLHEAALGALEQAHQCLTAMMQGNDNQPPANADLAASHNNLGLVHTQLQRYDEALDHYQKAQDLFGQALGRQHAHVGSCALNAGLTLVQQDKLSQAKDAFGQARDIWLVALGSQHEQTQMAERYANDPATALSTTS